MRHITVITCLLLITCYAAQGQLSKAAAAGNQNFVPGDHVVFYDDFKSYKENTFPSRWKLFNGGDKMQPTVAYVKKMDSIPALYFGGGNGQLANPVWDADVYTKNKDNYWTVEFDFLFVPKAGNTYNDIGIVIPGDPNVFATCGIRSGSDTCYMQYQDVKWVVHPANYPALFNKATWHHFAVSFSLQNISCYIDNTRLIIAPNTGFNLQSVAIFGRAKVAIKNFKIARTDPGHPQTKLPETRKEAAPFNTLLTTRKFVTHAITFDINSTRINPSSMPFMHELADFLAKNPEVKLEIDGHTDNDGRAADNKILSENRAKAIKNMLVSFGIAAARLQTKGYGASRPVDTNSTPEGRALNRRVEFIRL